MRIQEVVLARRPIIRGSRAVAEMIDTAHPALQPPLAAPQAPDPDAKPKGPE